MTAHVTGANVHRNRLRRMARVKEASIKALYDAGEMVRADAQASIRAGAVSGAGHVPSAPGQPPNADTHRLDVSIDVRINPSRKSVSVISLAPYSAFLEFGTSRMVERPFMRPALRRNRNRIVYGQVKAVRDTVRVLKGS
jgi:HK97 gp10 family phage protein